MGKIDTDIYRSLTPAERAAAVISARARGDSEELDRLFNTCPTKVVTETDPTFTRIMDRLIAVAMSREIDLLRALLHLVMRMNDTGKDPKTIEEIRIGISSLENAWAKFAEEFGVKFEDLKTATVEREPMGQSLINYSLRVPADPELKKQIFESIKARVFA